MKMTGADGISNRGGKGKRRRFAVSADSPPWVFSVVQPHLIARSARKCAATATPTPVMHIASAERPWRKGSEPDNAVKTICAYPGPGFDVEGWSFLETHQCDLRPMQSAAAESFVRGVA